MTRTATPTHQLDAALDLIAEADGRFTGRTTAEYANMVGPFGGVTAATLLAAVLRHPERLGDPVSLTVNFAGPVADGEFSIDARPSRTNRSTQHWSIEMTQGGDVVTTATAVFAVRRDTWSATEIEPPAVPPAAEVEPSTAASAFTRWVGNYEMRFVEGGLDSFGTERAQSTSTLWIRDEPARPLDFPALTALCDSFFPRVFLRLGQPCPIGTVSLTVYFHADQATLAAHGTDSVLATARAQRFGKGYFDQSGALWGSAGALLATTHQVVYYKA
ncbi:acyl-CoA thioesterase [Rhodococcus sp. NPDC058505]|uniref:acyl-CoA thioesterase n=1 Tax=unclassified Rhodococcus (in: high G+C Gram-positive bacteria) TaxID=192944 RepID=UPI0036627244